MITSLIQKNKKGLVALQVNKKLTLKTSPRYTSQGRDQKLIYLHKDVVRVKAL